MTRSSTREGSALADRFNQTAFSRRLNSRSGRAFRVVAGIGFAFAGTLFVASPIGIPLIIWSLLPLTAGGFDVCWISFALGGPLAGPKIRARQ